MSDLATNISSQPIKSGIPLWQKIVGAILLVAAIAIPIIVVLTGKKRKPSGPPPPPTPSPGPGPSPTPKPSPGPSPTPKPSPGPKVGDSCGATVNGIQFGVIGIKNLPTGQKIGTKLKSTPYTGLKDCVELAQKHQAVYLGVSTNKTSQVCNVYDGNGGTTPTDEYTWMFTNKITDCGCDVGFAPPDKDASINDMCNACDSKFTDCVGYNDDSTDVVVDPNKKLLQVSGEQLCHSGQLNLCCNAGTSIYGSKCGYGITSVKNSDGETVYPAKCGCKKGTKCGVITNTSEMDPQIIVNCEATSYPIVNGKNYRCCKTDTNCKGNKNTCLFPNGFYVNWGDDDSLNNDAGVY